MITNRHVFCLVMLASISPLSIRAQSVSISPTEIIDSTRTVSESSLRFRLLKNSFEPSYITVLSGWGNHGDKLLFEGNIAPHLAFAGDRISFVFTPKIILRMLDAESAPVRRPSFMPRGTLYYQLDRYSSQNLDILPAAALTVSHHSNGQDGSFYLPENRELNTRDGSFSLNYAEMSLIVMQRLPSRSLSGSSPNTVLRRPELTSVARVGIRANLPINESEPLRDGKLDEYGTYRIFYSGGGVGPVPIASALEKLNGLSAIEFSYVVDPEFRSEPYVSWSRFDMSLSAVFMPTLSENAGILFNYYWGQDYYNISYKHRLKVFRVGILMNSITSFLQPR